MATVPHYKLFGKGRGRGRRSLDPWVHTVMSVDPEFDDLDYQDIIDSIRRTGTVECASTIGIVSDVQPPTERIPWVWEDRNRAKRRAEEADQWRVEHPSQHNAHVVAFRRDEEQRAEIEKSEGGRRFICWPNDYAKRMVLQAINDGVGDGDPEKIAEVLGYTLNLVRYCGLDLTREGKIEWVGFVWVPDEDVVAY